jgi:purine-binding chemotaxis protein CheW
MVGRNFEGVKNMSIKTKTSSKSTKRELNWQVVYDRIAAAKLALENSGSVSEQERERVWKERAVQFARAPEEDATSAVIHLAIIRMGHELCAFDVVFLESIRPMEQVTRVPRSPSWIVGVSNIRGQVYSVTDLQIFLHLNNVHQRAEETREILLVKTDHIRLALLVDQVRSVDMVVERDIKPASDTIHGVKTEFIRGVIDNYELNNEKTPVLVLNMETLLSDESLIVREEFV